MLFLFDYGDGWRFVVELKEIKYTEKRDLTPVILKSIGAAPIQYPPREEDSRDEEPPDDETTDDEPPADGDWLN